MKKDGTDKGESSNPFGGSGLRRSPVRQSANPVDPTATSVETPSDVRADPYDQVQEALEDLLSSPELQDPGAPVELVTAMAGIADLVECVKGKSNIHKEIREKLARVMQLFIAANKAVVERLAEPEAARPKERGPAETPLRADTIRPKKVNAFAQTEGSLAFAGNSKRKRGSPGELRPGDPKKRAEDPSVRQDPAASASKRAEGPAEKADEPTSANTGWRTVSRKRGRPKGTETGKAKPQPQRRKRRVRERGEAIVVKAPEGTYADVLRQMRTNEDLADLGEKVRRIRRTRTGEMILELKRGAGNSSGTLTAKAAEALGDKAEVRALCKEVTIRVKNLDEVTTEDELRVALVEQCKICSDQMTVRLRNGPPKSGMQIGLVKLPVAAANAALKCGRLKVGWSICQISIPQQPDRCFKCLLNGHKSFDCTGPDRSGICWRCSETGHKSANCKKPAKCPVCAGDHAVGNPSFPIQEVVATEYEGMVVAKVNGIYFCSCYAPPRWSLERFGTMVDKMVDVLMGKSPIVIAGDFNAWAVEWGSRLTNPRGQTLLEALARLNVDLANVGNTSTYQSWNGSESTIDVTFGSPGLVSDWMCIQEVVATEHEGMVIAKVNGIHFCRCYAPPRWSLERFGTMVDKIVEVLTGRSPIVMAGDLNAWADEWGSPLTNPISQILLEALARLNVDLTNVGNTRTYHRNGSESTIDVSFGSPGLVRDWMVRKAYTNSDQFVNCYRLG
ncbi:uncharacterized protein LOC129743469 [Uranotaenia lowii]|uniref:uncharacterized protein LOC129743469 n=1 Tax=Uranotaenia lowii TaxID=190385 RepID=UPI00247A5F1A|nr:uncharacterized protein LOC129743469 [Uranotaenia lowii]